MQRKKTVRRVGTRRSRPNGLSRQKRGRRGPRPGSENIREKIFHSAEKMIADRGFSNFTLSDVAKIARVHPSMISYYYGGKKRLIDAVVDHHLSLVEEFFDGLRNIESMPPAQALDTLIRSCVDSRNQNENLYRIGMWILAEHDGSIRKMVEQTCSPVILTLSNAFHLLHPGASPAECEARAALFFGISDTCAQMKWSILPHLGLKTSSDEFMRQYLRLTFEVLARSLVHDSRIAG